MSVSESPLLEVEGLTVDFDPGKPSAHRALDGVSLSIGEGEIVGLVGESGSGKTVLSHSILGLLPPNGRITEGRICWQGRELQNLSEKQLRPIRGKEIAMIFQNPQESLNEIFPVGRQVEWVLKAHRGLVGPEAKTEVLRLFEAVKLRDPERCYSSYAHKLSGGMSQRVYIAMALACRPKLLIADEPTSALDVTTQAEIVELLREVLAAEQMAMLFVSHDLGLVGHLCTQISVIQQGIMEESGAIEKVLQCPESDYTRKLIAAARLHQLPSRGLAEFATE